MKILHLSTFDNKGGAARSAFRRHKGLLEIDVDSKMFVYEKHSNEKTVSSYKWPKGRLKKLKRKRKYQQIEKALGVYKNSRPGGYEPFSQDISPNIELVSQLPDFDIINLHWVAGFVDVHDLFDTISDDKKIVWELHDMNALTGGCHYDDNCDKFIAGCHQCPQLGGKENQDLSYQVWERKKRLFDQVGKDRLHFVTPSKWLGENIQKSSIFGKYDVSVIPYGLDTSIFKPRNKAFCREIFDIPQEKKVILFVSDSVTNKRKGFHLLLEALNKSSQVKDVVVCAVGGLEVAGYQHENIIQLGNINDDRLLSMAYSMADVFVIPSLQDNLPNTVLESLSCGTPVVGFPVGGIKDMISYGENGFLSEEISVDSLAKEIEKFLRDPDIFDLDKIREKAVEMYNLQGQAQKMYNLYLKLNSKNK